MRVDVVAKNTKFLWYVKGYLLNLCKVYMMMLNKKKAPTWCSTPSQTGTPNSSVKTPKINCTPTTITMLFIPKD